MEASTKDSSNHGSPLGMGSEQAPVSRVGSRVGSVGTAETRETFEVSPREGGWQVRRMSDASTVSIHSTIQGATEHAKSLAYEHRAEFAVRGPDGRVITRDGLGRNSSQPPASTVNMFEARNSLTRLLERVEAGETILITKAGKAVAKLCPCEPAVSKSMVDQSGAETESQHG